MNIKTTKQLKTKNNDSESFLSAFMEWLTNRPEFDVKKLAEAGCWPVTGKHYRNFSIKKRNGSVRELVTVNKSLKLYQSQLRKYFERDFSVSKYAYGFVSANSYDIPSIKNSPERYDGVNRPKGVVTNALAHANKKVVISIDLKDFFPSITFPRILGMLKTEKYGFSNRQAAIIASLVCLPKEIDENRGLPQGAPTSPLFSNLICKKLDYQLGKLAAKYDLTYTRYADDLTFSTNNIKKVSPQQIVEQVTNHVIRNGFLVNEAKTKIMFKNHRQMVTGILVNDGLNLHKPHVDALRATLYNLEHKNNSLIQSVLEFWKLPNKQSYDAFLPVGFYKTGKVARFIHSNTKGIKGTKAISIEEMHKIYALHLLGRIHWYGQVVTTAVNSPYGLSNRNHISPKQYSRIKKYEGMLASFYRISIKFNWDLEHIIFRLANKLNHLQALVNMHPSLLLEPIVLSKDEQRLIDEVAKLKNDKKKYDNFFQSAPKSLQRAIRVASRSHDRFKLEDLKRFVADGWPDPIKQKHVFSQFDNGKLSDLFHKSSDTDGHSVNQLLTELVKVVRPNLRYLSPEVRRKVTLIHKELLALVRKYGANVRIDLEKRSSQGQEAIQAIRELKAAVRLYENDVDNFYTKIVLPAVNDSGMKNLVRIDKRDMEVRFVTDIKAWRSALKRLLDSVKEHMDPSERLRKTSDEPPYAIVLRDADPIAQTPIAIEIYRRNTSLAFKKLPVLEEGKEGTVKNWIAGGDLSAAVREFLPVGDIFVHGNYADKSKTEEIENITINLTEHSYVKEPPPFHNEYGKLMFSFSGCVD